MMLADEVAIVTGGAQGIGHAIAERFAREGARVGIADANEAGARQAAEALSKRGGEVIGIGADIRDADEVEAMYSVVHRTLGTPTILVNNAGITRDASLRKMSLADWQIVIDVHLRGAWLCTKAAAEAMRQGGRGSIINMSSTSGKVGMFGQTNYSAAKAGVIGLTKAAAKELGRHGVRVNAIQPGLIRTPMTGALPPEIWAQKEAEVPLGRAGDPAEVAAVALFLASDLSSYVTGAVIEVSGGRLM